MLSHVFDTAFNNRSKRSPFIRGYINGAEGEDTIAQQTPLNVSTSK